MQDEFKDSQHYVGLISDMLHKIKGLDVFNSKMS